MREWKNMNQQIGLKKIEQNQKCLFGDFEASFEVFKVPGEIMF